MGEKPDQREGGAAVVALGDIRRRSAGFRDKQPNQLPLSPLLISLGLSVALPANFLYLSFDNRSISTINICNTFDSLYIYTVYVQ